MALYDSADCLSRLRVQIRQPSTSDLCTDAQCYLWLGEGQIDVFTRLAVFAPLAVRIAPTQMATSDGGYTYTFGTDSALPTSYTDLYPIGSVEIFRTRNDIPDWPMIEGVDYLMEGNQIRMPGNAPYSGTAPYYQSLALPASLDGSTAPTLKPVQARELIVDAAAVRYAKAVREDLDIHEARYEADWARWLSALQTQYARPGSVAASHPNASPSRWRWGRPQWMGIR